MDMCYQSVFKWWRHLHYCRNNSQRQFEHRKFDANFENLLLQNFSTKFLDITYKYCMGMCNQSLFKWWRHLHHW